MPLQHITILYLALFAVYRLDLVEFAVNGAVIFFTTGRRLIPGEEEAAAVAAACKLPCQSFA